MRDCGTAGLQDSGTAGLRDCGTAGLRDCGTAGLRNCRMNILMHQKGTKSYIRVEMKMCKLEMAYIRIWFVAYSASHGGQKSADAWHTMVVTCEKARNMFDPTPLVGTVDRNISVIDGIFSYEEMMAWHDLTYVEGLKKKAEVFQKELYVVYR